ncbi:hypothetical protein GIY30_11455 [Gordonia sp. HNM0687]|uniref:Uncharacterized protein n=1 Tax=Gordonia mangrovi TaxID=2665643 RepID=A0A6L7GPV1_9ACTN|nr:hypothetical protein [Gordonia mangrovi]MXP21964.1 hypothetical protein [Gordonia mangrovi]UVF76323.1 hypothetical protein NWF22_13075 [Gordonia mangrovi]
MGLVLGLVGVWYSTRSPNFVFVPGGASGDSLGLNLVTEPLLLVIPVVFVICYGLTAMLLAGHKPKVGRVIGCGLPVGLVVQIDGSYGTAQTSQWLAHEMGHAIYPPEPIDRSTYQTCVDSFLIGEGQATFNNIVIQREIIAAGGMDIGISGPPAGTANAIYDRYLGDVARMRSAGIWTPEAEQAAKRRAWTGLGREYGQLTTSTTGQRCANYYGQYCQ